MLFLLSWKGRNQIPGSRGNNPPPYSCVLSECTRIRLLDPTSISAPLLPVDPDFVLEQVIFVSKAIIIQVILFLFPTVLEMINLASYHPFLVYFNTPSGRMTKPFSACLEKINGELLVFFKIIFSDKASEEKLPSLGVSFRCFRIHFLQKDLRFPGNVQILPVSRHREQSPLRDFRISLFVGYDAQLVKGVQDGDFGEIAFDEHGKE